MVFVTGERKRECSKSGVSAPRGSFRERQRAERRSSARSCGLRFLFLRTVRGTRSRRICFAEAKERHIEKQHTRMGHLAAHSQSHTHIDSISSGRRHTPKTDYTSPHQSSVTVIPSRHAVGGGDALELLHGGAAHVWRVRRHVGGGLGRLG